MSTLQKLLKSKGHQPGLPSMLPPRPPSESTPGEGEISQENGEEEEEADSGIGELPTSFKKPCSQITGKDYLPLSWDKYFDTCTDVQIPGTNDTFRVYEIKGENSGPAFVMHHGGGHSALTFGLCAKVIKQASAGRCSVLAFDCRGHGATKTKDEGDMSLNKLSSDMANVVNAVYNDRMPDSIILVGHSMGGAVAGDVASKLLLPKVTGLAIIDVVEGSAIESLEYMVTFLGNRPSGFKSVEKAIEWTFSSNAVRNIESARLSTPPQLVPTKPGDPEYDEGFSYRWRTDLQKTEPYWNEWFAGLSEKFLTAKVAKLLILAGTDRLDKPLTIGQMQGKFQLDILPAAGHTIQEDDPKSVGTTLYEFMKRNERLVLPKKVGEV